jgi:hypothetical protein
MIRRFLLAIVAAFGISAGAEASLILTNSTTINTTWTFDFETGLSGGTSANTDVWWHIMSSTSRELARNPFGTGAMLDALGAVSFSSITEANLVSFAYSASPINGADPIASTQLATGDVFAVHTNEGNYVLAQILGYNANFDMQINYNVYNGVIAAIPEPETYAMMLAGLGLLGLTARRRKQNLAA